VNGFRQLQERLREEGWYVGWNLPCCQSCAWSELPDTFADGTDIDLSKVLFNHSQDCEVDHDYVECETCDESGYLDDDCLEECADCAGEGYTKTLNEEGDFDTSVSGFVCHTPEQQLTSTFCFDGSKKGVKNLKTIIPIIEECGCKIHWDGTGKYRPDISWENK
jgi:hypothetical protein